MGYLAGFYSNEKRKAAVHTLGRPDDATGDRLCGAEGLQAPRQRSAQESTGRLSGPLAYLRKGRPLHPPKPPSDSPTNIQPVKARAHSCAARKERFASPHPNLLITLCS